MTSQEAVAHYAELLANNGYIAYTFDFNGRCSGCFTDEHATVEMSVLTEVDDLITFVNYIKTLPYVKNDQMLLMGRSQGALVVALAATQMDSIVSKIVLFCPAFCIPDEVRAGRILKARFDAKNIPENISVGSFKIGSRYVTDIINMDPYKEIELYKGEALIVHGSDDKIVDISYAQKAYNTYKNNSKDRKVEFYVIENAGHRFTNNEDAIAMIYVKKFINE